MQVSLLGTTYRNNACQNGNKKLMPVVESFHGLKKYNNKNTHYSTNKVEMKRRHPPKHATTNIFYHILGNTQST